MAFTTSEIVIPSSGGEDVDVADAVYALDLVDQVNVEVVFDEIPVEASVRRRNRADQRHVLGRFFRRDAVGSDFGRKAGRCDGDVVLHQHRVHIAVRAQLEIDVQRIGAAVVRGGGHIVHTLGAVDLLLNDLGNGVVDDLAAGACIGRLDADRRRRYLRVLRDWQAKARNGADDDQQESDDDGENRTIYEES